MRALVLEFISHSNKAEQLAQTNVERQKRVSTHIDAGSRCTIINTQQDAISHRSIYLPHRSVYKQCYTALSAIARLPSIECSLQEATYLSKGRTVVCPVVPELASTGVAVKIWSCL